MRLDEFDSFKGELKQLCATFGKPYSDPLGQAYWRVLRDLPLEEVRSTVERLLNGASADAKLPKPNQLRGKRPPPELEVDPKFTKLLEANRECWADWFARDPEMAAIELGIAKAARIMATEHEGSLMYAEARQEDWMFRERRRALTEKRRGAA